MSDRWGYCCYCNRVVAEDDGLLVVHRVRTFASGGSKCDGSGTEPTDQPAPDVEGGGCDCAYGFKNPTHQKKCCTCNAKFTTFSHESFCPAYEQSKVEPIGPGVNVDQLHQAFERADPAPVIPVMGWQDQDQCRGESGEQQPETD